MAVTIDQLQIEIQANATKAAAGIDALTSSLNRLRGATKGGVGLLTASKQLERLAASFNNLSSINVQAGKIQALVKALQPLSSLKAGGLGSMSAGLKRMAELSSSINGITESLKKSDMNAFAAQIRRVADAMRPLADEAAKVYVGLKWLPSVVNKVVASNGKLTISNIRAGKSFGIFGSGIRGWMLKLSVAYMAVRRIGRVLSDWINESNAYVENLNLFTVAMGEYAEEAKKYAEEVQEAVGIDASEFMRYQGVFMNMARGFGVAADKAALMSKNLTQLGYDLASLYNVSFDTAMRKIESGLAGQPRPMREWGFDLSEATLKAKALELGITKNVEMMSQAEKSMIRYVQLLDTARKIGATGDFARTIGTSANQLRILKAQATLAARALGNIFIPALNAILPYAIAFLRVVRWVAQELANLFGFKLPEIDYSGLDGFASGADDAADAMDNASGSAKKLKGMLAGFDEINIIQQEMGGGGAGGVGGAGGGDDLGIQLPEYDFLAGLADSKAADIFRDMVKWAKRLWPILKKIAPVLAGLWVATKLIAFATWIKSLIDLMGTGGLVGTLSKVASALTGLAIGFAIGALVSYVANIIAADKGTRELGYAVTGLLIVLGGAVTAIGVVSNSIGIAFAGIGLILGAIAGLVTAQDQLMAEKVSDWFYAYGEGSITITDLADAYSAFCDEVISRQQPIIDAFAAYKQAKESVSDVSAELDGLLQSVQYNTDAIKETLPKIQTAFDTLLANTKTTLSTLRDSIIMSLAGATGDAYEAMGGNLADIYALLDTTFGAANDTIEANEEKIRELTEQYNRGDISESAFISGLIEAKNNISELTLGSLPELATFKVAAETAFDGIKFEDADAVSEALERFKIKTDEAKDAILRAAGAQQDELDAVKNIIKATDFSLTPEQEDALATWQEAIEDAATIDIDKIDKQFHTAASAISANLVAAMKEVGEKAFTEDNNATYVATAMAKYYQEIVVPVQNKLIEANGSIGKNVADQTENVTQDIWEALFAWSPGFPANYVASFKTDIESAFKKPLADLGKSIPQGVAKGVGNNVGLLTDATKKAAQDGINAFGEWQGSSSPATKYIEQGKYAMEGVELGVEKNISLATNAMKQAASDSMNAFVQGITNGQGGMADSLRSVLSGMNQPLSDAAISMYDKGREIVDRIAEGIRNAASLVSGALEFIIGADIKLPEFSTMGRTIADDLASSIRNAAPNVKRAFESLFDGVKIKLPHFTISGSFSLVPLRVPTFSVKWYASGGFPLPGELFIARESGPEMVGSMGGRTAVANNDQIVEGVSVGVERANSEQNALLREQNRLLRGILEKDGQVVFPNTPEAGRAVTKAINSYNMARGMA